MIVSIAKFAELRICLRYNEKLEILQRMYDSYSNFAVFDG